MRRRIIILLNIVRLRSPYAVKNHCNLLVQTCFMLCHCLSFRLNILLRSLHFKRNIVVGGRLSEVNYCPFTLLTSPSLKYNIMYQFKCVKIIYFLIARRSELFDKVPIITNSHQKNMISINRSSEFMGINNEPFSDYLHLRYGFQLIFDQIFRSILPIPFNHGINIIN
jgi:hypothetical protein